MGHPDRPQRVGRFVVEGELGRGSDGLVLVALDERLGRQVALKRLPGAVAADPERRRSLEEEAQLLAAVNHPNVATLYGLEEDDEGALHLVMELVPGQSLARHLAGGALPLAEALDVAAQLAEGLAAAHERGVLHRDLKPSNVLVTPVGRVKILDFGLARRLPANGHADGGDAAPVPVAATSGSGSPGYMSPEQVLRRPVGARSDAWALGCVVYECLTGKRAFGGDTFNEALTATLYQDPDWAALPEDSPAALRGLLERSLAKEPEDRWEGVEPLRETLRELADELRVADLERARRESHRRRLPVPRTSFVGRQDELQELAELLTSEPLVTLSGPGGSGKSRLALEAARRAEEAGREVGLVELAPVREPSHVRSAALSALGLRERPGRSDLESLAEALAGRDFLLVLDNCEHLLSASAELVQALHAADPKLTVLATSRERLALDGESVRVVRPLATGEGVGTNPMALGGQAAVRLFVDRARAVRPDFEENPESLESVARLCRRVDGLPLAIELAASRLRVLSLDQLESRLEAPLRVLAGGGRERPDRTRTMQAAIDWSHDLLTEKEKILYRRLSVFVGGWTVELMEEVCAGDGLGEDELLDLLTHLIDKSLVESRGGPVGRRFHLLELVREHAAGRLAASDEEAAVRRRHLEALSALMTGGRNRADLRLLAIEEGNVLAAAAFARERGQVEEAVLLTGALEQGWLGRGRASFGLAVLEDLVAVADDSPLQIREGLHVAAAALAARAGRFDEAESHLERARPLLEGDRREALWHKAYAAQLLGRGRVAEARPHAEAAVRLLRGVSDPLNLAAALSDLAFVARFEGDFVLARSLHSEGLQAARTAQDERVMAGEMHNLAMMEMSLEGPSEETDALLEKALSLNRKNGLLRYQCLNLIMLAESAGHVDLARAERLFAEAFGVAQSLSDGGSPGAALLGLARCALARGDLDKAEEHLRSVPQFGEGNWSIQADIPIRLTLAEIAWLRDEPKRGLEVLAEARRLVDDTGFGPYEEGTDSLEALLLIDERALDRARQLADGHVDRALSATTPEQSVAEQLEVWAALALAEGRRRVALELADAFSALPSLVRSPLSPASRWDGRLRKRLAPSSGPSQVTPKQHRTETVSPDAGLRRAQELIAREAGHG